MMQLSKNSILTSWLNYTVHLLLLVCLLYGFLGEGKVYANEVNNEALIETLKLRLSDEEQLLNISKDIYEQIDQESTRLIDEINKNQVEQLYTKNYLIEQFKLQAEKINLQRSRIRIDQDTIAQEIIAEDNMIYQFENKLQFLVGSNPKILSDSDSSINREIKRLQNAVSYHKSILAINKKRFSVLKSHFELVNKLKDLENTKLLTLQQLVEESFKHKSLITLSEKELEINNQIKQWLEREMSANQQMRSLDLAGLDSNENLTEYNNLRTIIVEAINSRGLLELELSFLRLNTRLSDIAPIFDQDNKDVLKSHKNLSERIERLRKEAEAIKDIANKKIDYISEYTNYINKEKRVKNISESAYIYIVNFLQKAEYEYKDYLVNISNIGGQLKIYSDKLKDLYLKDVSIRQTLPESWDDWQLLVQEIITIPYLLSKQVLITWLQFTSYFNKDTGLKIVKIIFLQLLLMAFILSFFRLTTTLSIKYHEVSFEKVSTSFFYVFTRLLDNNRYFIAGFVNAITMLWFTGCSGGFITIFISVSMLFFLIRFLINTCYIFLIQNTIGISGDDSRLYKGLKYSLVFGGFLSAFMVMGQALNLTINTLSFIDRLFMLFLLAISYPLIMNWQVVPQLLVDGLEPKPYVRRVIWLLGIIVPVTILSNAALGIIGYVNLAWTIAVAEFQLSLVIALWLIFKGLLSELMDLVSRFFIRNVTNGWLWTESVLKPLHSLLAFLLFIISILGLVFIYGWNSNSELFATIDSIIDYSFDINLGQDKEALLQISIKDLILFSVVFAVVIWATKWSREFSYRWLYAKTKDLAVRNSFSVFTQYATLMFGIILILKVLGIPTATLMVTVGGLLFFLGWGLRDILSNYISGIILLIERPVRTGDFVTIGDFEGKITKIGMRSLTVQSFDNMEVIVPNTDTITKPLINWTFRDTVIRLDLDLRITYEENLEKVKELILEIFNENEDVLDDPMPMVYFKEFSETAVIAKLYYYIDLNITPSRGAVRTAVMLAITKSFSVNDIKVAYPKQTVNVQNAEDKTTSLN